MMDTVYAKSGQTALMNDAIRLSCSRTPDDVMRELENPRWSMQFNWTSCVPRSIRENWDSLSKETRLAVYYMALLQVP